MRILLPLFLFCLLSGPILAQEGFFAFVNNESGRPAKDDPTAYKYDVAKQVFDDLVAAQGDFRRQSPKLVMKDSEMYVAWARPESAEIGLEELAYDICVSFGADSLNALAALLTHELVHYYEKHDWRRHFIQQNEDLPTAQRLEKLEESLKLEAQADYEGGFVAYSAGYNVHGIMPQLLRKIYAESGYDLPEEIPGYPSLQDRLAMSTQAMDRLQDLQIVSETAKYLQMIGSHKTADDYYQYILRDFQSRDVYNNVGANLLWAAMELFTKKEMPYALPIELDPESRLTRPGTRDPERDRIQQREELIKRALAYFERAWILDKDYLPAYLNQAIGYILLSDWKEAESQLYKLMKADPEDKLASDVWVARGLMAALRQNREEARAIWLKELEENNNPLAELNLELLENGPLAPQDVVMGFATKSEQIASVSLDKFLQETAPDRMVNINERTICGFHQRDDYRVYSHSVDAGREFFSVQLIDPAFTGKSMEGIQIGDDRAALIAAYGKPDRLVAAPKGTFAVYPQRNMLFELDENGTVVGWGVYRVK